MVRVVAGSAGGLKLKTVDSASTKPTLDRVKEPMFSMLAPYIPGRLVLDLFAGSGALGIEALSRGAERCWFNDSDIGAVRVIRQNLEHTHLADRAEVSVGDYEKALRSYRDRGLSFGLVLLDPPYRLNVYEKVIFLLVQYGIIDRDCVIMCEHGRELPPPEVICGFSAVKRRGYGTVGLSIYTAGAPEQD